MNIPQKVMPEGRSIFHLLDFVLLLAIVFPVIATAAPLTITSDPPLPANLLTDPGFEGDNQLKMTKDTATKHSGASSGMMESDGKDINRTIELKAVPGVRHYLVQGFIKSDLESGFVSVVLFGFFSDKKHVGPIIINGPEKSYDWRQCMWDGLFERDVEMLRLSPHLRVQPKGKGWYDDLYVGPRFSSLKVEGGEPPKGIVRVYEYFRGDPAVKEYYVSRLGPDIEIYRNGKRLPLDGGEYRIDTKLNTLVFSPPLTEKDEIWMLVGETSAAAGAGTTASFHAEVCPLHEYAAVHHGPDGKVLEQEWHPHMPPGALSPPEWKPPAFQGTHQGSLILLAKSPEGAGGKPFGFASDNNLLLDLQIFGGDGKLARTLGRDILIPRGETLVLRWNGLDDQGKPMPSANCTAFAFARPLFHEQVRRLYEQEFDPVALATHPGGGFAILTRDDKLLSFDPQGKPTESDDLPYAKAQKIIYDSKGCFYVLFGERMIGKRMADGKPDNSFGKQGVIGGFGKASDFALMEASGRTSVLVADTQLNAILKFDAAGKLDPSFGQGGTLAVSDFKVTCVAAESFPSILIGGGTHESIVMRVDATGKPVATFRDRFGQDSHLLRPEDDEQAYTICQNSSSIIAPNMHQMERRVFAIRVGPDGLIYLTHGFVNEPPRRIQVYNSTGNFKDVLGEIVYLNIRRPSATPFFDIRGFELDRSGGALLVADAPKKGMGRASSITTGYSTTTFPAALSAQETGGSITIQAETPASEDLALLRKNLPQIAKNSAGRFWNEADLSFARKILVQYALPKVVIGSDKAVRIPLRLLLRHADFNPLAFTAVSTSGALLPAEAMLTPLGAADIVVKDASGQAAGAFVKGSFNLFYLNSHWTEPAYYEKAQNLPLELVEHRVCYLPSEGVGYREDGTGSVQWPVIAAGGRDTTLLYRVTGKGHDEWYRYKLLVKHPGRPHLLVIEYPNDRDRHVSILYRSGHTLSGGVLHDNQGMDGGFTTGLVFPKDDRMLYFTSICFPPTEEQAIYIVNNRMSGRISDNGAASRMWLFEVKGDLPVSAKPGTDLPVVIPPAEERRIGYWVPCPETLGAQFGPAYGPDKWKGQRRGNLWSDVSYTDQTLDGLIRFVQFMGYNFLDVTALWFHTPHHWYPSEIYKDMTINGIDLPKAILERTKDKNIDCSFTFYGTTMRPKMDGIQAYQVSIDPKGNEKVTHRLDPAIPEVQDFYFKIFKEFAEKYASYPHLKGATVTVTPWEPPLYPDFNHGYSEADFAIFTGDTKVTVQGSTPAEKMKFVKEQAKDQWIAWRCRKAHQAFLKMHEGLASVRKDLFLFLNVYCMDAYESKERGLDLSLYAKDAGIRFFGAMSGENTDIPIEERWSFLKGGAGDGGGYGAVWVNSAEGDPKKLEWDKAAEASQLRGIVLGQFGCTMIHQGYYEMSHAFADWVCSSMYQAQPYALEPFVRMALFAQPEIVEMHAWGRPDLGADFDMRRFVRSFRAIPRGRLAEDKGDFGDLKVMRMDLKDKVVLAVFNPSVQPQEKALVVTLPAPWKDKTRLAVNNITDSLAGTVKPAGGKAEILARLAPFDLVVFWVY